MIDREMEEEMQITTVCNHCGATWTEKGDELCPTCLSDNLSTVFVPIEDDDA